MNKSVIILTPHEWEGRKTLIAALRESQYHLQQAVSKQANIDSTVQLAKTRCHHLSNKYEHTIDDIRKLNEAFNLIFEISQSMVREIQAGRAVTHQLEEMVTALNEGDE